MASAYIHGVLETLNLNCTNTWVVVVTLSVYIHITASMEQKFKCYPSKLTHILQHFVTNRKHFIELTLWDTSIALHCQNSVTALLPSPAVGLLNHFLILASCAPPISYQSDDQTNAVDVMGICRFEGFFYSLEKYPEKWHVWWSFGEIYIEKGHVWWHFGKLSRKVWGYFGEIYRKGMARKLWGFLCTFTSPPWPVLTPQSGSGQNRE